MSFTYKNQASLYHPIIIISIFLIAFGLCGFVLFRILHSFMNLTTGSGISPIFTLPWLSSIILGTTVLFSALSFRKRPFINGRKWSELFSDIWIVLIEPITNTC